MFTSKSKVSNLLLEAPVPPLAPQRPLMSQGDAARASERWSLQPTNSWAGIYNTYYWIDPKKRIAANIFSASLSHSDEASGVGEEVMQRNGPLGRA